MHTARSLTVSRRILCMPPCNHACPPATIHAPPATTYAPWQPCMPPQQPRMPPGNHACPLATMHTPSNHACPPATTHTPCNHAHPPATTHAPQQPHMPPGNHTCPPATTHAPSNHTHLPATMHAPQQPCTPPSNHTCPLTTMHAPPWTEWHTCKNITFPQTLFAGGNNIWPPTTACPYPSPSPPQTWHLPNTVSKQAVCILLECFLVLKNIHPILKLDGLLLHTVKLQDELWIYLYYNLIGWIIIAYKAVIWRKQKENHTIIW